MKKLFLALFVLCITASYGLCSTMNSYDSYGRKAGSYKTSGRTTTSYDSYGRRTGTIRETSSGYNTYDSYGRKTSTVIGIAFCFLAIVGSGILLIINSFIVSIFIAFEKLK